LTAKLHLRHLIGEKPKFVSHPAEQLNISAAVFPERESFAEINLFRMEPVVHDLVKKIFRRLSCEITVKSNNDRLIDPKHFEIRETLIERLKQRRSGFGMKNGTRVRVECDRGRRRVDGASTFDDRLHYFLMAEMKPIKNAQRQNGGLLDVRVFSAVKDFHMRRSGSSLSWLAA
jgi:hypothetical protein